jgi:hypothetical protein
MANEFIARNGLIAQSNSTITGSLLTTGNVGVGTNAPISKLHVERDAVGPVAPETRSAAFIYNTSTDLTYGNSIGLYAKVATYGGSAVYGESVQSTGYAGYFIGNGYFSSDVGIGTTSAETRLHVEDSVTGPVSTQYRAVIYANNTSTDVIYANAVGVYAKVATTNGIAVYGSSANSNGYGGYFEGKGYFSENVGIGKAASNTKLDVSGSTTITGSLQVTQGITGSLFGTSSWAISSSSSISSSYSDTSISASYALTASYVIGDGGGTTITTQEEGSTLSTIVTTLNFVGAGVVASGTGDTTTVTIAGGGGGGTSLGLIQAFSVGLQNIF